MTLPQSAIKGIMNRWVSSRIHEDRKVGKKTSRALMAQHLNVTQSCFSQYLNPRNSKASTWEFQIKLAALLNKSIRELHPELIDLSFF